MRPQLNPLILGPGAPWSLPGSSLDIQFTTGRAAVNRQTSSISSLLTTTRASTGYATTSTGFLTLFPTNTPRITDLGLLVEQAATNLALQSQTFDNSFWAKNNCTVTADQAVAPDGTQTADLVVPAAASGTYKTVQSGGVGIAITGAAALSVYYKPAGYNFLAVVGPSNIGRLTVNVAANSYTSYGGAGFTAVSTALGNGWYRVVVSATSWISGAGIWIGPINAQADPSTAWTADGVSGGYLWGAQGEAGSFATSYIPTTTVSVTRAADSIVPAGTAANAFTPAAISIFVQSNNVASFSGFPRYIGYSNGHAPLQITNNTKTSAYNGSVELDATLGSGTVTGGTVKTAIGYDGTGRSIVANNGTVATDANVEALGANSVFIGAQSAGGQFLNGYIARLAVFGRRLSDTQLQGLTQ